MKKKGFAALKEKDPTRLLQVCANGGRQAHQNGTAFTWTKEQASAAGRKGAEARKRTLAKAKEHQQ